MKIKQIISFIIAPIVSLTIILFADLKPGEPAVTNTMAVALLMAVWWITEAVPLAVTSLLPVALFPILGIMDAKIVLATYFNNVIFLFMGGFIFRNQPDNNRSNGQNRINSKSDWCDSHHFDDLLSGNVCF